MRRHQRPRCRQALSCLAQLAFTKAAPLLEWLFLRPDATARARDQSHGSKRILTACFVRNNSTPSAYRVKGNVCVMSGANWS